MQCLSKDSTSADIWILCYCKHLLVAAHRPCEAFSTASLRASF